MMRRAAAVFFQQQARYWAKLTPQQKLDFQRRAALVLPEQTAEYAQITATLPAK
ncbi:MAG: hypothetical protein NDJ19_00665 [Ramlibacter sp.]|nr:hypothetical protein [Ramlibacter sp.]